MIQTKPTPGQPPSLTSATIMRRVAQALIPGIVIMIWLHPSWAMTLIFTTTFAVLTEAICIRVRLNWFSARQQVQDCSALLTGLLLGLCLPPASPWWLASLGGISAIAVGKQLYGGLGANPFNPAMVGYLILLLGFPQPMSQWPSTFDGITSPTLLDRASQINTDQWHINALFHQNLMLNLGFMLGGIWLWKQQILKLRIPFVVILSFLITQVLIELFAGQQLGSSLWRASLHAWVGAVIFGAFFIATDPVSAPLDSKVQILYGIGIGVLTAIIRQGSQYPDGFAFAVLLMNIASPSFEKLHSKLRSLTRKQNN